MQVTSKTGAKRIADNGDRNPRPMIVLLLASEDSRPMETLASSLQAEIQITLVLGEG